MRNKRLAAVMVGMALGLLPKLYAQDLSHDWPRGESGGVSRTLRQSVDGEPRLADL
jgi:hypothetical protein